MKTESPLRLYERPECDLVGWIFSDSFVMHGALRYCLDKAVGYMSRGWVIDVWTNLPREELGLKTGERPGDIDILMVPTVDGDRFVERSVAIEVKRAFIPKNKRSKSPGSFGVEQTQGLVRDGFPFVSVLHLLFVEDSDASEMIEVPLGRTGVFKSEEESFIGTSIIDPIMGEMFFRQNGRMNSAFKPPIGYNSQVYQVDKSGLKVIGRSESMSREPDVNPRRERSLLEAIRNLDIPPEIRLVFHYSGVDIRWRDSFHDPSPLDKRDQ